MKRKQWFKWASEGLPPAKLPEDIGPHEREMMDRLYPLRPDGKRRYNPLELVMERLKHGGKGKDPR